MEYLYNFEFLFLIKNNSCLKLLDLSSAWKLEKKLGWIKMNIENYTISYKVEI